MAINNTEHGLHNTESGTFGHTKRLDNFFLNTSSPRMERSGVPGQEVLILQELKP